MRMTYARTAQLAATTASAWLLTTGAWGQGTFSVDFQGPPIGLPDACAGGPALTEGDILRTFTGGPVLGFQPNPCIVVPAGPGGLGLPAYAPGNPPGVPGFVEVDALSYGRDQRLRRTPAQIYRWHFSVDEFAAGVPFAAPDVFSEGAAGNQQASADLFRDAGVGSGPWCVSPLATGNTAVIDGDGLGAFGGPGLGLFEPNPFAAGVPDLGTNIDALDIDTPVGVPTFPVYFSLDGQNLDPLEGIPGTNSAGVNGLGSGADVFVTMAAGAFPVVYAPANALGLDFNGFNTDDLDALVLLENGDGVFQPPTGLYSWLPVTGTDMIFFSLRRGSATLGAIDSLCGLPIAEGDILAPPLVAGGPPAIWVPAEALGLQTVRAGFNRDDELDALDTSCRIPGDANGDGQVNGTDLGLVLGNFGCAGPPPCPGDVNGDGLVDLTDLATVLASFGVSC